MACYSDVVNMREVKAWFLSVNYNVKACARGLAFAIASQRNADRCNEFNTTLHYILIAFILHGVILEIFGGR